MVDDSYLGHDLESQALSRCFRFAARVLGGERAVLRRASGANTIRQIDRAADSARPRRQAIQGA